MVSLLKDKVVFLYSTCTLSHSQKNLTFWIFLAMTT